MIHDHFEDMESLHGKYEEAAAEFRRSLFR